MSCIVATPTLNAFANRDVATMPKRVLSVLFLLVTAWWMTPTSAGDLERQRNSFLAAEKALDGGASREFRRLSKELRDYPLYPYLEYRALSKRIDRADNGDIRSFLETHADTPLADLMRNRWLDRLARRQRWSDYLAFYRPTSDIARRCHQLHALIATGKTAQAFTEVPEIWLYGRSRPSACDPVFAAWERAGLRTDGMVWQRVEKAIDAGETRLADYLARSLSKPDRAWVKQWIALFKSPDRAGELERFREAHPYREAMLAFAVRRKARWDGLEALALWQQVKPRYPFSTEQINETERYIVRNLERSYGDLAYDFVRSVDFSDADIKSHEARIRTALLREDWKRVIAWIAVLPQAIREQDRWSYWLARALEGSGETAAANALYAKTAGERTYYGFMAADRIGGEYHLDHNETPARTELLDEVAAMDGVRRAEELFRLERWTEARREWREVTRNMDAERLKAAAKIAERHGWHDRAIFTLAKTGYWDDLELRFPMEHADLVDQNAKLQGIENAWIFAVMRQESAFMSNAYSHAGAVGLMQLMPATARNVARNVLKRRPPRRQDLLEPDTNIALGSAYLKQMKGELGDSAVLATAAYNAGPHRVTRWLPERTLPADIWIELVPFEETRGYLRRVLAYTVIYEKRMGRTPTRLNERLHPVPPDLGLIGSRDTAPRASAG